MSILSRSLGIVFTIIEFAVLARVLISWFPVPKENYFIRILYQITEPILAPIRSAVEKSALGKNSMFDFSPVIALLLIWLIRNIVLSVLRF